MKNKKNELTIENKKKLFVAYPWDLYIQGMYEDIFKLIFKKWEVRHGSNVTLDNKDYADVEKFLYRNKNLYDVFVTAIEKSDFFIADVTKANPNVMLELGVAIQMNKNVLIVTSEEHASLPFDIKGFRVGKYKTREELINLISDEVNVYKKIKSQDFSNHFNPFYFHFPSEGELKHNHILPLPLPKNLKNLRLRLEYKFIDKSNSHDWLGVHLRASLPELFRSELVYVRENESLESVSFPGRRLPEKGIKETDDALLKDDFKTLELIIDENSLRAKTACAFLSDDKIVSENVGGIALHAFAHHQPLLDKLAIRYRNIEIISLDTTTPVN